LEWRLANNKATAIRGTLKPSDAVRNPESEGQRRRTEKENEEINYLTSQRVPSTTLRRSS
jgi:hypothetical protein